MWDEQSIRNYIGLLESKGLPVIFDLEHLRRLIGVEKQYFYKLTNSINESYSFFTIRKRTGISTGKCKKYDYKLCWFRKTVN